MYKHQHTSRETEEVYRNMERKKVAVNSVQTYQSVNWTDELTAIKNEGATIVNEIKAELTTNSKGISARQLLASSKLRATAVPLMEKIVEIYGEGASLLSNPPEYDVCLKLSYDVEFILKSEKEHFTARYRFPLDGVYKVEGYVCLDDRQYPEIPVNEANVRMVVKNFLKEYNKIVALKEKRKLAEQKKHTSVVITS